MNGGIGDLLKKIWQNRWIAELLGVGYIVYTWKDRDDEWKYTFLFTALVIFIILAVIMIFAMLVTRGF